MCKIVNNKLYKSILSKLPLLSLLITTISTNYYYFFDDKYYMIYDIVSYMSGFSLTSLVAYFYIVYKFNFCTYSKIAVWGLFSYVIINLYWKFSIYFYGIKPAFYAEIFESCVVTLFLGYSICFMISNKINKK